MPDLTLNLFSSLGGHVELSHGTLSINPLPGYVEEKPVTPRLVYDRKSAALLARFDHIPAFVTTTHAFSLIGHGLNAIAGCLWRSLNLSRDLQQSCGGTRGIDETEIARELTPKSSATSSSPIRDQSPCVREFCTSVSLNPRRTATSNKAPDRNSRQNQNNPSASQPIRDVRFRVGCVGKSVAQNKSGDQAIFKSKGSSRQDENFGD